MRAHAEEKTEVILRAIDDSCDIVDDVAPKADGDATDGGKGKKGKANAQKASKKGEGGFLKLPFGWKAAAVARPRSGGKIRVHRRRRRER